MTEDRNPKAFGFSCPWTGDDNDPMPLSYRVWVRAYWFQQRTRHRFGLHEWRTRGPIERGDVPWLHCDWCGANKTT